MNLFASLFQPRTTSEQNEHEHAEFSRRMDDFERRLQRLSDVVAVVQREPQVERMGPVVEH